MVRINILSTGMELVLVVDKKVSGEVGGGLEFEERLRHSEFRFHWVIVPRLSGPRKACSA